MAEGVWSMVSAEETWSPPFREWCVFAFSWLCWESSLLSHEVGGEGRESLFALHFEGNTFYLDFRPFGAASLCSKKAVNSSSLCAGLKPPLMRGVWSHTELKC